MESFIIEAKEYMSLVLKASQLSKVFVTNQFWGFENSKTSNAYNDIFKFLKNFLKSSKKVVFKFNLSVTVDLRKASRSTW